MHSTINNLHLVPVPPYPAVPLVLAKSTVPGVDPAVGTNPVPGLRGAAHKACVNEPDAYGAISGGVLYTFDLQPAAQAVSLLILIKSFK